MTKSERTRQHIIEKAAPLINKKGMAGTSITDIMEATHLAKGGVYGNFESKDEISLEVFDYLRDTRRRRIDEVLSKHTAAKDKLFALLDVYGDVARHDLGGCPILNFGIEADDTNPQMRQRVREAIKFAENRFVKLITQGIADKEFSKRFDAETFSIKAFAMLEGGTFISRTMGNQQQMKVITDILKKEIEENLLK
ncbi:MAG TPA: TetR/AcrR family transcriptional regulator [Ohtaekwangia sp.]|uniref:TetR/AcrR family transcriptional regulator n=1 Tax=Ohtaekwangia sp. TaxID=2066019 RepID=UPI002F9595D1